MVYVEWTTEKEMSSGNGGANPLPKSKRPGQSKFKQQKLKAWQPVLSARWVIGTFVMVGVVFIPIGAALLAASNDVKEVSVRYDDVCGSSSSCSVTFDVPERMDETVYMYYELHNFYQNHRKYVSSRNDEQLHGANITELSELEDCKPYRGALNDLSLTEAQRIYNPCGLIAFSLFNDSVTLQNGGGTICDTTRTDTSCKKDGIAWSSDVEDKFKPAAFVPGHVEQYENENGHMLPISTDEDLIVWMRTAALPTFRKLFRILEVPVEAGSYTLQITNRFPVDEFSGQKWIVLSTTTWMGGKNPFLGVLYVVVGILSLVFSGAICVLERNKKKSGLKDGTHLPGTGADLESYKPR